MEDCNPNAKDDHVANKIRKMPWNITDDIQLIDVVRRHGTRDWAAVSDLVPGRNSKQCRERWMNHLSPDVKNTDWTSKEDNMITTLQQEFGNKWSKIAKRLVGRTDNAVKNRFHWLLRHARDKSLRKLSKRNSRSVSENSNSSSSFYSSQCISVSDSIDLSETCIQPDLQLDTAATLSFSKKSWDQCLNCNCVTPSSTDISAVHFSTKTNDVVKYEQLVDDRIEECVNQLKHYYQENEQDYRKKVDYNLIPVQSGFPLTSGIHCKSDSTCRLKNHNEEKESSLDITSNGDELEFDVDCFANSNLWKF